MSVSTEPQSAYVSPLPPWYRDPATIAVILLAVVIAVAVFSGLVRDIANPWSMNDDMRRVIGMRRPELPVAPDGPARNMFAFLRVRSHSSPPTFDALVSAVSLFGDPWAAAKWGTFVLLAAVLVPCALMGRNMAGVAGACAAVGLVLHADVFVDRAAGSLVRGFAFPIVAWQLYALTTRRDALVLWLMVPAAFIYPPVLVTGGGAILARVGWALAAGELRGRFRRLLVHATVAGVISVAAVLWHVRSASVGRIFTYAEAAELPELGPAGRGPLQVPFQPMVRALRKTAALGLRRHQHVPRITSASQVALMLLVCGGALSVSRIPRRVWGACGCVLAGGLLGYVVARAVAFRLYAPDRYLTYTLPLLTVVLWLAVCVALARRIWATPRAPAAGALVAVLGALVAGGPGIAGSAAFGVRLGVQEQAVAVAVRALPRDAVLSGPADLMDSLFAVAHRHTYVSDETLQPIQPHEWAWMKTQYIRHIEAYYAVDWEEVRALEHAGVTHMVVRRSDLDAAHPTPDEIFYEPFRSHIAALRLANGPRGYVFARPPAAAVVFETPYYFIVDLTRIPEPGPA